MRTVVIKISDGHGVEPWCEPFKVTSGRTAVEEVQAELDNFNKGLSDKDKRFIVELHDISVDLPVSAMSKAELKELSKVTTIYLSLLDKTHKFNKVNLVSNRDGSDDYRCKDCGLNGKRTGLTSSGLRLKAPLGLIKYCKEYKQAIGK